MMNLSRFGLIVLIFAVTLALTKEQDEECKSPDSCIKFNICCQKSCEQKARAVLVEIRKISQDYVFLTAKIAYSTSQTPQSW